MGCIPSRIAANLRPSRITAEPAWHRNARRRRAEARTTVRLAKAVSLLEAHHGSSAGKMPAQDTQQPSSRGRWRKKTVWQLVENKRRRNASAGKPGTAGARAAAPPYASYAAAASAGTRRVTVRGGADTSGDKRTGDADNQWTIAEWTEWHAGGWKDKAPTAPAKERDEARDAATLDLRQQLHDAQAIRDQHAKSKNPCPAISKLLD